MYIGEKQGEYKLTYFPGVVHDGDSSHYELSTNNGKIELIDLHTPKHNRYPADASFTPGGIFGDGKTMNVTIDRPTKVATSSSGVQGIAILADPKLTKTKDRPQVTLTSSTQPPFSSVAPSKAVLYTPGGDLRVFGGFTGQGTVVSGEDITFEGRSVLEPSDEGSVSVFARGDVNLQAIVVSGENSVRSPRAGQYTQTILKAAIDAGRTDITDIKKSVDAVVRQNVKVGNKEYKSLNDYFKEVEGFKHKDIKALVEVALQTNSTRTGASVLLNQTAAQGGSAMRTLAYQDQKFAGLVYAGGSFKVDSNSHSFIVQGALVAFGNSKVADDSSAANATGAYAVPGAQSGSGDIILRGGTVNFTYDPEMLQGYSSIRKSACPILRTYWAAY